MEIMIYLKKKWKFDCDRLWIKDMMTGFKIKRDFWCAWVLNLENIMVNVKHFQSLQDF